MLDALARETSLEAFWNIDIMAGICKIEDGLEAACFVCQNFDDADENYRDAFASINIAVAEKVERGAVLEKLRGIVKQVKEAIRPVIRRALKLNSNYFLS